MWLVQVCSVYLSGGRALERGTCLHSAIRILNLSVLEDLKSPLVESFTLSVEKLPGTLNVWFNFLVNYVSWIDVGNLVLIVLFASHFNSVLSIWFEFVFHWDFFQLEKHVFQIFLGIYSGTDLMILVPKRKEKRWLNWISYLSPLFTTRYRKVHSF